MEIIDAVVRVGLVLATTILFGIVLLAYLRSKSRKMLFITLGFGTFFFHALITMPELFSETFRIVLDEDMHLALHLIGLLFLLIGTLKD